MVTNVVNKAAGLAAGGVGALKRARGPHAGRGSVDPGSRWITVTIYRPLDEVAPGGRLPKRLAALGSRVETAIRPAPGDRGTEVAARPVLTDGSEGDDQKELRDEVRVALRQDKQELEVGEVLVLEPVPHGKRSETPTGKLVDAAAKRAGTEGLL
jgi:hypothetical protein